MVWVDWLIFILCIVMIAISALQSSKEDVLDAFTNANSELFKSRKIIGAELVLNRVMFGSVVLFFIFILWSNSIDRFFM